MTMIMMMDELLTVVCPALYHGNIRNNARKDTMICMIAPDEVCLSRGRALSYSLRLVLPVLKAGHVTLLILENLLFVVVLRSWSSCERPPRFFDLDRTKIR